jgi:hypothetical protein
MSLFNSFSKPKQSTLGLNLERPKAPPAATKQPAAPAPQSKVDPALLHAAVPDITERANAMFEAGIRPVSLYLAIDTASMGAVSLRMQDSDLGTAMMVFTSGFQAVDYLRAFKIAGGVHEFPATSLQSHMRNWKQSGAGAFALDRCPRCPTWLPIPIRGDLTDEQVCRVWAIHRATRTFQAQRYLRVYLDTSAANNLPDHVENRRMKRNLLESIRDHLDCSVPYLHWMIAMEAGMSRDEDVRLVAIERLHEFGPTFRDKASLSSDGDAWVQAVAECHMGLLESFGMLKPELQAAMKRVDISSGGEPPTAQGSVN